MGTIKGPPFFHEYFLRGGDLLIYIGTVCFCFQTWTNIEKTELGSIKHIVFLGTTWKRSLGQAKCTYINSKES